MTYDQVKRVWDIAKTEALDLQHPSKKNARVKDLRTIAEDLCEKMLYRFPQAELDEFIQTDAKFKYEPVGGVHTPWSDASEGHWFQKLRCHLDLVNFVSLFGVVLFYNPEHFVDKDLMRAFLQNNKRFGAVSSTGEPALFHSTAPWDLYNPATAHKITQPVPLPCGDRCFVEVQIADDDRAPVFFGLCPRDGGDDHSVLRFTVVHRWERAPSVMHQQEEVLRVFIKAEVDNYKQAEAGAEYRTDLLVPHDYQYGTHTLRVYVTISDSEFKVEVDCARNATYLHLRSQGAVSHAKFSIPHKLPPDRLQDGGWTCFVEGLCICRLIGTDNRHLQGLD